jgi:hypothetical protein
LTEKEIFKEAFKMSAESMTVKSGLAGTAPTQLFIGSPYHVDVILDCENAEALGIVAEFRIKRYELLLKMHDRCPRP